MPTPIEILLDPISLAIIAMFTTLFIWESIFPAREQPEIKYWKIKGLTVFVIYFYLSTYLPLIIDQYLIQYQMLDLSGISTLYSVIIGTLLFQLGIYTWHRSMHKSDFLWRIFHQMHHSAERVDMPGAFFFSPMDMIGFTVLGSLCFALIIGLSPQAITITLLFNTFIGMFQHANINTPVWLGYIVQRPESHSIHHAKNVHAYNYSDLPIYDIIFGTFKNPTKFESEAGFYIGASSKIGQMILFKDISETEHS